MVYEHRVLIVEFVRILVDSVLSIEAVTNAIHMHFSFQVIKFIIGK